MPAESHGSPRYTGARPRNLFCFCLLCFCMSCSFVGVRVKAQGLQLQKVQTQSRLHETQLPESKLPEAQPQEWKRQDPGLQEPKALPTNPAIVPVPNEAEAFWMPRHIAKVKEVRERHPVDLVMIGDSITQSLEQNGPEPWSKMKSVWDSYYAPFHAINLGFNSDTTANVLWRLQNGEIENLHPKVVVLEIGTNNTGRMHWSAQQTIEGIEAIVDLIHKNMLEAKIVLLKILPCGLSSSEANEKVNVALMQKFASSESVSVVDVSGNFMQDGKLNRALFIEGQRSPFMKVIHPSSDGHEKIAKALQPILQKLMPNESSD